jgi:hypothetical protein
MVVNGEGCPVLGGPLNYDQEFMIKVANRAARTNRSPRDYQHVGEQNDN